MIFRSLSIETLSYCNRRCATCLRQAEPDKEARADRSKRVPLPGKMVMSLIDQSYDMGFRGVVSLSYYNEPLYDERIHRFGRYAKQTGEFKRVQLCTNGDRLNKETAKRLDGCFDMIWVSLYDHSPKETRKGLRGLFSKTRLMFTSGLHQRTHQETEHGMQWILDKRCNHVSTNMIVAYNGDVLACCEEIVPHFGLGNVHDTSLKTAWENKQELVQDLLQPGGRRLYPYCMTCLRTRTVKPQYEVVPA